jgi:hypothetical protein
MAATMISRTTPANPVRFLAAAAFSLMLTSGAQAQSPLSGENPQMQALHGALRLRPDQEVAWKAFEDSAAPDPDGVSRRQDILQQMSRMTGPQRVDASIDLMRQDLQSMESRATALKEFYAVLSSDQQAAFDRQTLPAPMPRRPY